MGMFDVLHYTCPNPTCKERRNSEQFKSGPCTLENYTLLDAPLSIIAAFAERSKEGQIVCNGCGSTIEVRVQFRVELVTDGNPDSGWRTA